MFGNESAVLYILVIMLFFIVLVLDHQSITTCTFQIHVHCMRIFEFSGFASFCRSREEKSSPSLSGRWGHRTAWRSEITMGEVWDHDGESSTHDTRASKILHSHVYMYTYIVLHTCTCMYLYSVHADRHTYTRICMHMHTQACIWVYTGMHTYACYLYYGTNI